MSFDVDVFVVRQYLQLCAFGLTTFSVGIVTAFPSVINPAILELDADIRATPDEASWITACFSISGLLTYTVIPVIFEIFGRKVVNIITNLVLLIGFVIIYLSNNVYLLGLGRLIQGISLPGQYTFIIGLYECISPKRRGYFMVIDKIFLGLGGLTCHGLGFLLNWRQIALVNVLPLCISIILCLVTAESPFFYAMRGQFDKCAESFKWYRGGTVEADKELKELVVAQREIFRFKQTEKRINFFKKMWKLIITRSFQKSFCIVMSAKLCLDFCGRYYMLAYITQIFIEITNNRSLAMYLSIVSDLITIFGLCISYFLVKHYNRRFLLFYLGFCSVSLMFMVSLSLILGNKFHLLQYVKWLTPIVILLHIFITNSAFIPLIFILTGEVFSLEHRGIGMSATGIVFISIYSLILKYTPMLIAEIGVAGVYFTYGTCLLVSLTLLRIVLIETKDKTLQQIEDELKEKDRNTTEDELLDFSNVRNC